LLLWRLGCWHRSRRRFNHRSRRFGRWLGLDDFGLGLLLRGLRARAHVAAEFAHVLLFFGRFRLSFFQFVLRVLYLGLISFTFFGCLMLSMFGRLLVS